jgi:leucyl/phenylalanyl-tRNA--protein transferase
MGALYWLDPENHESPFPPVEVALDEPDGLLAVGGSLAPERLLNAYRHGIFPWYSDDQPILWWSPDPRSVLFPEHLHISRSLRKTLRQGRFRLTMDRAFAEVIDACAEPRPYQAGTWITPDMRAAYLRLHRLGVAHSVETWEGTELAGGLYGVALGRVFFGESMFARRSNASKVAFVHLTRQLQRWGYPLIDCQVQTGHLDNLGAQSIPRAQFVAMLDTFCEQPGQPAPWSFDADIEQAIG